MNGARRAAGAALGAAAAAGAAPTAYVLALLAAAASARRRTAAPESDAAAAGPAFAVVVPAHDEQAGVAETVRGLRALRYEPGFEVIVVADNCVDATAQRAREAGATVWVRDDPERPGKGRALAWAFDRLDAHCPRARAVALVDADCTPSPNLLAALGGRLAAGARAVQASYAVANPAESYASAARFAGFALINHVRPLGRSALGLSCGLLGTGMAFERELLRELPWDAFGVAEDAEYHLRLVDAGAAVEFAPEARVASRMPTSLAAAATQAERWESGGFDLARARARRLVGDGLRRRDPRRVAAGAELLVPPQSLTMAANAALAGAALACRARAAARISAAALAGQVAFVLGGLALVRAPLAVYRGLALAPLLAARNVALRARLRRGWRPAGWVRTRREPR